MRGEDRFLGRSSSGMRVLQDPSSQERSDTMSCLRRSLHSSEESIEIGRGRSSKLGLNLMLSPSGEGAVVCSTVCHTVRKRLRSGEGDVDMPKQELPREHEACGVRAGKTLT